MQSHVVPADRNPFARNPVPAVQSAVDAKDRSRLVSLSDPLHEAGADGLPGPEPRHEAAALGGKAPDSDAPFELDERVQTEIAAQLPSERPERTGWERDSDDAVDLIETLEAEQRQAVLARRRRRANLPVPTAFADPP